MTMNDQQQSTNSDRMNGPDAVGRYLAGEAAGDDAAIFARCDAVMTLAPKLAGSADVAWAFDEARELARRDPRGRQVSSLQPRLRFGWMLNPGVAWGAAGALALVLVFALQPRGPAPSGSGESVVGDGLFGQTTQSAQTVPPPVQNFTFAPIVISTELAQALAEVRPVVLLADRTPVDSRSLVVMPFTASAGTNDPGGGAISADAIYTQVYRQLAAIPGLYLIDPATAAVYAGSDLTATEIAQQLGVRGILEGNVDSINGNILFSLNFTDAATAGSSIIQSIERPAAEVGFLQSDIASSVLVALARTPPPDPLEPVL
jgi:TolB-like protein